MSPSTATSSPIATSSGPGADAIVVTEASLDGLWNELAANALLGTDRRPIPTAPLAGPAAGFGVSGEPAVALLDRLAAVQAMRRAGTTAEPAPALPPPCAQDSRRPCPPAAAVRLGRLTAGRHLELLPEWLRTLADHGLLLPPEHVFALMERTRRDADLRDAVVAAAGPIVAWMAEQLPGLGWPSAGASSEAPSWDHGSHASRLAWLRARRAADPAAARVVLAAGLPGETAERRADLYATLAEGLSADDEPLLEQALDDRSALVRDAAATLLARLPSSAWAGRAAERACGLVRVDRRPTGGRDRLDVTLVAPVPPVWERDGVDAAAPRGASLGVHILRQVVAAAPVSTWEVLGPPGHLVVLAAEHELGPVLLAAWAEAAARDGDATWAGVLFEETAEPALVPALSDADRARALARLVHPESLLAPGTLTLLEHVALPWPVELRGEVADALVALFADRRAGRHQAPLIGRMARLLDPAMLVETSDALMALGLAPPVDGVRDDLAHLLGFRAAMLEELAV